MDIGNRIRELREEAGLSVRKLAEMSECTPSFISQLEHNLANPSINTLKKIASAFNVPLVYFFEEYPNGDAQDNIVRKNKRKKLKSPSECVEAFLLSPENIDNTIEMHMLVVDAGGKSDQMYINETEEVGYIIKGSLVILLNNKEYLVEEGDSIYFSGQCPHGWENRSQEESISLWATTPPLLIPKMK